MLSSIFALAVAPTGPVVLPSRVVSASLFKNGYALVVRQVSVPKGGTYAIDDYGAGVLGTVWLSASDGVTLKSFGAKDRPVSEVVNRKEEARNVGDLLRINEGKAVVLTLATGPAVEGRIGKVLTDSVTVHQGAKVVWVPLAEIKRASGPQGFAYERTVKITSATRRRSLVFRAEATGPGKVNLVALERGLTWSPAYQLDLGSDGQLTLTSQATILNDLARLSSADVRFVTGFPNIESLGRPDPLTTPVDVNSFLAALDQGQMPFVGGQMMNQVPGGMGGMGGGGFGRPTSIGQPGGSGKGAEELFFYFQPAVELERGERAVYGITRVRIPFERQFVWDVASSSPEFVPNRVEPTDEVWSSVKFKNTTGMPLTTGAASILSDGQLVGQSTVKYSSRDQEVEVRISKALDVRPEALEEETDRQRNALNVAGAVYDLVTVKGTLQVTNFKDMPVALRMQKSVIGEVLTSPEATRVTKTVRSLRDINGGANLVYEVKIEPGKSVERTYTYRVYVRT